MFWRRKRKNRTRLTAVGRAILIITVLVLFAAWNTGTNLLYVVFGGLMSFYFLSSLMAGRTMRKLVVKREAPMAVHRGDTFSVHLRIENRKRLFPSMAVRVEKENEPGVTQAFVLQIPPRRAAHVRMTETIARRGVHKLPPVDLASGFPFGLLDSRMRVDDGEEVVVYPRIRAVKAARLEHKSGSGDVPKTARSDGDEYFSLREYVPGDDPRKIAWRQSARLGSLLVRELEQETARYVLFVFDTRWDEKLDAFEEYFEEAVELVASLAVTLLNRNYQVALQTPEFYVPEGEGKSQANRILDKLARITPAAGGMAAPFDFFTPHDAKRATQVLVAADPRYWGVSPGRGGPKVLDPKDVIHA